MIAKLGKITAYDGLRAGMPGTALAALPLLIWTGAAFAEPAPTPAPDRAPAAIRAPAVPAVAPVASPAAAPEASTQGSAVSAGPTGGFLAKEASVYARFQASVEALRANKMASTADLNSALQSAAAQEGPKVGRGWIAFSALIAARNPVFVASVRKEAELYGRAHMLKVFAANSSHVRTLNGAAEAEQAVLATARGDAARIGAQGQRFLALGYSLQKLDWGKGRDSGEAIRAQLVSARAAPAGGDTRFWGKVTGQVIAAFSAQPSTTSFWTHVEAGNEESVQLTSYRTADKVAAPIALNQARAGTLNAALNLAAWSILEGDAAGAEALLAEKSANRCFLDEDDGFRQCVTAMTERFSRAACIGNHALGAPPAGAQAPHGIHKCISELVAK